MGEPTGLKASRNAKASVFEDLFSDPKYLLMMYKALHPEDTDITAGSLKDVKLRTVLTTGPYNDCSFIAGDKCLLVVEAQSTFSVNILVRSLLYTAKILDENFKRENISLYSTRKVIMPNPEIYVIYTGERKDKPEYLSLREEFFGGRDTAIEVRAKVIYESHSNDIINQYIVFCKIFNEQVKMYGYTREAIRRTIKICIEKNILKNYLKEREVEVMGIMESLFDQEEVTRRWLIEERDEAQRVGEEIGRGIEVLETAERMIKSQKLTLEEISAFLPSLSMAELKNLAIKLK